MIYEDNKGNLMMPDEVDELSSWEIEDRGIRLSDEIY
jgi:hypothetical protein